MAWIKMSEYEASFEMEKDSLAAKKPLLGVPWK